MGEFSWAYISGGVTVAGPERSVQFRSGSDSALSGTGNFTYNADSDLLVLSGSMEISGTLTANQYNINVENKTVTNISASGDTKFGDSSDDTHQFTGSVAVSTTLSASSFYGDGTNLSGISTNNVSGSKGSLNTDNGILTLTGSAAINGGLTLTGSLVLTGSGQSLIVLDTRDADTLKEIVFNKDGSAAAAIQVNSAEHMFIENENAKDIILRANNQNTLRVIGAERKVIVGAVTRTSAHAELDVEGSAAISGTLAVSGSSTIGFDADDQSTFGGGLTASLGISLGQDSFVASDKNIVFGSSGNSVIQYNSGLDKLIISGSLGGGGIDLQGGGITIDFPAGTIASGSLAGPGSMIGLGAGNQLILTKSAGASVAGANTQIQFNNSGDLGASENFVFDTTDSELQVKGNLQVSSGSVAVLEIDSGLTPGASGSVRGRLLHVKESQFDLTSAAQARTGRYVSLGPSTGISQTLTRLNGFLSPFSGRLVSITYHMASANQDPANGQCGFGFRVADINSLNGNTFDAAATETSAITASSWPGQNSVGSVNVQTGAGALGGMANVTGTFAFGTGSAVGIFFKSGDASANNFPGNCSFTIVFELDQLDQIVSGSGN